MSKPSKKVLIFLGPPGSGKGTQAKLVAQKFGFGHISTGDMLRALASKSNLSGEQQEAVTLMKAGQLVPDQLIYSLVFSEILQKLQSNGGVVLDGAIRNAAQAAEYQKFFENNNVGKEVLAIDIELTDAQAVARLSGRRVCQKCGVPIMPEDKREVHETDGGNFIVRPDDSEAVVKQRVTEQGNAALEPIRNFYRGLNALRGVNGNDTVDKVAEEIEKTICS